jgi:hypothetical protein
VKLGDEVEIKVGYNYRSYIHFNFPEFASRSGSIQGRIKRIDKVTVNFFETLGISHGSSLDNLTLESFRNTSDPMDLSPEFRNGYFEFDMEMGYNRQADFYLVQDQPYPFTILQTVTELVATQ